METLIVERDAGRRGVWHVTLNRPESRNAMSLQMVRELRTVLTEAEAAAGARVLVLRGAGGHFCAGGDIRDMAAARAREAEMPGALAEVNAAFGELCVAFASTGRSGTAAERAARNAGPEPAVPASAPATREPNSLRRRAVTSSVTIRPVSSGTGTPCRASRAGLIRMSARSR